jgi:hypothetical protein
MSILHAALEVLDEPAVRSINFRFDLVHIHYALYARVRSRLARGLINLVVNHHLASDVGAQYTDEHSASVRSPVAAVRRAARGRFELPPDMAWDTVADRALFVHEATHAALDQNHIWTARGVFAIHNEAIAYIVEALYLIRRGGHSPACDFPYCVTAFQIASGLAGRMSDPRRPPAVLTRDINQLLHDLRSDRGYRRLFHDSALPPNSTTGHGPT